LNALPVFVIITLKLHTKAK